MHIRHGTIGRQAYKTIGHERGRLCAKCSTTHEQSACPRLFAIRLYLLWSLFSGGSWSRHRQWLRGSPHFGSWAVPMPSITTMHNANWKKWTFYTIVCVRLRGFDLAGQKIHTLMHEWSWKRIVIYGINCG